jgi:hypothetical protein
MAMNYKPRPPVTVAAPLTQTLLVVVEPDERPFKGRSSIGPGFVALIPLVPYGRQQISPDLYLGMARGGRTDFRYELADTVVADLRAEGVARRVMLREDFPAGERPEATARYLHLTLREGIFHRTITAYGMSFAGALFWFVGAPVSFGRVELDLAASVTDESGRQFAATDLRGEASMTEFLYYSFPAAASRAFPEAFDRLSEELRPFVRNALRAEQ